jgi:exodeoxyribonuclease VII small subunit
MQKLRSENIFMDMDKLNFEDAMKRVDEIVAKLEDSTLKLDESLVLYEEGVTLVAFCRKKLEEAQRRITCLTPNENGEIVEKTFSAEEEK